MEHSVCADNGISSILLKTNSNMLSLSTMDGKNRVLIVDDEPGIGDILSILLKHHGYDVITAISGVEAIELIRRQPPDVVLLDMLPNVP